MNQVETNSGKLKQVQTIETKQLGRVCSNDLQQLFHRMSLFDADIRYMAEIQNYPSDGETPIALVSAFTCSCSNTMK